MLDPTRWFTNEAQTIRTTLYTSITGYSLISRIFIAVIMPAFNPETQAGGAFGPQKAMFKRITDLLNTFHKIDKIEVVYRSPANAWLQIRCLAPLYGLTFPDWELSFREGNDPLERVPGEPYWDIRLRGHFNASSQ
ncbi:hypothetical protein BKA64DRAFT_644923 [Cadophora sp. MPI-SDFR-AT-0126]|nr:hypothetical protein BKA64DRAFT_644923 [Leotiomycetes sp. MPI-SDFR-AT-0126]